MLLALDIGNTNIKTVLFEDSVVRASWRLTTDPHRMPDEYSLILSRLLPLECIDRCNIDAVAICSVVPPLTGVFKDVCTALFDVDPLVVSAGVKTGIKVNYDNASQVGADRIVDSTAAYYLYGGPAIVVDCGTATVFDCVTAEAEFIGGAIAPGLQSAADGLLRATSQLRRVELTAPPKAIGRNTVQAIQSGAILSHIVMIEGMVRRFKRELGDHAKVIGTGGLVDLVARESRVFDEINDNLMLHGLRLIYAMNRDQT